MRMNDLPRIALVKDAAGPEIFLAVNGVKLHIPSPSEMTALGFDWGKVRTVPRSVVDGLPTQSFSLPPSVKPSAVFLGVDQGEGGPKDIRSVVARDILVAGWLLQEQGLPSVNGGIAGNMGDGFGVADIVYGDVRLDVGFLEALYGWQGLSSNLRVATLPGNPSIGAVRIPVADPSIINSLSLPEDDNWFPLEIHVELNCWHEQTRGGNLGTWQKAIGLGPHPDGWVQQSFHPDFTDCWWPFLPFNPDNTGAELVGGEYVLIRGALWQDVSHGGNPLWNVGVTKGHNGWLEIHPVDFMARIPPPGLVKTGVKESYAGGATRRSNVIGPISESATPLRVAAHESITDARFTMFATLSQQTATDIGDGVRVTTVVNPVGGQQVRYKGGHVVTWSLPAPALCSTDPNADRLDVFVQGRDLAIWLRRLEPSAGGWQVWQSLSGVMTSDPAAVTWSPGIAAVVARGLDGALSWKWHETASSDWQRIDDRWTIGRPAICSTDPNADRLEVVGRGRDGACWLRRLDPAAGGWQAWESLGGVLTSDPAVAIVGGVLTVIVRGTDGALYWKWYRRPGDSSDWQRIDDPWTIGNPAVCSTDPNADCLEAVARGRDDACWLRRLDPAAGGWQAWESLGGVLTSDPAVAIVGGVLTVIVRGTDGALYWKWYRRPGDSSGWQLVPGAVPGEPAIPLSGRLPEPLRPRE